MVDTVTKVEHVQLSQFCRKWVISVVAMPNVLSTL